MGDMNDFQILFRNEFLKRLERQPVCQSLTLYSFLLLPLQRITRWPLLLDAILKRLPPGDLEYANAIQALSITNQIVIQCNERAKHKDRQRELQRIASELDFGEVPSFQLLSSTRYLVRSGDVNLQSVQGTNKSRTKTRLFLFNDTLIITTIKNPNLCKVVHYCPRNLVELNWEFMGEMPRKSLGFTIVKNQDQQVVEFVLSCTSDSDRERWLEALSPPTSENPDEKLYESWDCPQVIALHDYSARQPDELQLHKGDTINVLRKLTDGWYHGEKIRNGETGWFPGNHTTEIINPHVRARNLKQRYRLLEFSKNMLL